jgi:outer membrane lipoprotein carrier protein
MTFGYASLSRQQKKGCVFMRRFHTVVIAVVAVLCLAVAAVAGAAELKDVVATLEQGYGSLNDLQADFAQRTTIAALNRNEKGAGELFLKRPARAPAMFRFDYTKPKQEIVSNGRTVWYYIPENRQVMTSDLAAMFAGGNSIALAWLTGMGDLSRDFTAAFDGTGRDRKGNYLLDLTPKQANQGVTRLQLTISAEAVDGYLQSGKAVVPFPVLASTVTDAMGNRTAIEFSRVKVNRGLGSGRFTFKIPKGVEVIRQ